MRTLWLLFLLIPVSSSLMGQCSVTKEMGKHSTTYIAKMETAFLNEDLEDGLNKYELSVVLNKDTDRTKPLSYFLQCRYTNSGAYLSADECVPRSITFKTAYGVFKTPLWALDEKEVSINRPGVKCRVYSYLISPDLLYYLKNASLIEIVFWDKRTQLGTPASPYKDLLKEQIDCVTILAGGSN